MMSDLPLLRSTEQINALARTLVRYQCVAKFDRAGEPEGGSLAHAFSDLEQSFRVFLDELLPRLIQGKLSEQEAQELLLQIGEEFRHIQYHLKDSKFYRYIQEDV